MSTRKTRNASSVSGPRITARPKSISDEISRTHAHESGLSVDADELGARFLSDATQQSNYESSEGSGARSIAGAAASDEALVGPNFDANSTPWEQAIGLSTQHLDDELREQPAVDDDEPQPDPAFDDTQPSARRAKAVNLRRSNIEEASLLDQDSDDQEELEEPEISTDDQR